MVPREQAERIQRLHDSGAGKTLVIVGNGPSILEAPLQQLTGRPKIEIMSINKPDPRLWPTRLWSFCDTSQYVRHEALWKEFEGIVVNSAAIAQRRPGTVQIRALQGQGFSRDLTAGFYIGRSTVYANLQTAAWMNYDHVYLFGVDMAEVNGQMWFYGPNPDAPAGMRRDRFKLEAEHYEYAASELTPAERGRYTFCSSYNPWPFVEKFGGGHLDHATAVARILELHG